MLPSHRVSGTLVPAETGAQILLDAGTSTTYPHSGLGHRGTPTLVSSETEEQAGPRFGLVRGQGETWELNTAVEWAE